MVSTHLHFWPYFLQARKRGATIVCIDPVRTKTARAADIHLAPRPGQRRRPGPRPAPRDLRRRAGGRRVPGRADRRRRRAAGTCGRVAARAGRPSHRRLAPEAITDLARRLAAARPSFIKLGPGAQRHADAGQAFRAVLCLPAVTGALALPRWRGPRPQRPDLPEPGRSHGASRPAAGRPAAPGGQPGPARSGAGRHLRRARAAGGAGRLEHQPGRGLPRLALRPGRAGPRGPVHRRGRAVHDRHRPLRGRRPARHHPARAPGRGDVLGPPLPHAQPPGRRPARPVPSQHRDLPDDRRRDGVGPSGPGRIGRRRCWPPTSTATTRRRWRSSTSGAGPRSTPSRTRGRRPCSAPRRWPTSASTPCRTRPTDRTRKTATTAAARPHPQVAPLPQLDRRQPRPAAEDGGRSRGPAGTAGRRRARRGRGRPGPAHHRERVDHRAGAPERATCWPAPPS